MARISADIGTILAIQAGRQNTMTISHSWTSGGATVTVTTKQGEFDEGETVAQCIARHAAAVANALEEFPKDS